MTGIERLAHDFAIKFGLRRQMTYVDAQELEDSLSEFLAARLGFPHDLACNCPCHQAETDAYEPLENGATPYGCRGCSEGVAYGPELIAAFRDVRLSVAAERATRVLDLYLTGDEDFNEATVRETISELRTAIFGELRDRSPQRVSDLRLEGAAELFDPTP